MNHPVVDRVLVVGSGIAGLATATALSRLGIDVHIIERDSGLASTGSGITLMAPALRVLRDLGVIDECLGRGFGVTELVTADANGEPLDTVTLPRLLGPDLPAIAGMYRPDLLKVLHDTALTAGSRVTFGTTLVGIEQGDRAALVRLSDGIVDEYDLVVAADGWLSSTRGRFFGDRAAVPMFLGQAAWRAVVRRPADATKSTFLYGKHRKAGYMPISQHQMYAYVVEPTDDRKKPPAEETPRLMREMLEEFGGLPADVREEIIDPALVDVRPLHRLLMPSPWYQGRVLTVGDAAHLATPQLGMGGAMAMEDGVVLADVLLREKSVEAALNAFMTRRLDRCRVIVNNSVQLSEWEKTAADHGPEAAALMNESHQLLAQAI